MWIASEALGGAWISETQDGLDMRNIAGSKNPNWKGERFSENKERRFDVSNGITLCKDCHWAIRGSEKQVAETMFQLANVTEVKP